MSQSRILVLTLAGDTHAYAVAEALRRKGANADLWHTSDFPSIGTEYMELSAGGVELGLRQPDLALAGLEFETVWNRRRTFLVNPEDVHEADLHFARNACYLFREGFFDLLSRRGFWVNPWKESDLAENKPTQLQIAMEVGLRIPDTLFTNDPEQIRRFIRDHGGRIAYKGLMTRAWTDGERTWMPYTSMVEEKDLPNDQALQNAPGIYQELLDKEHELRVTVIGKRILAAKVLSQETSAGKLDWRKSYGELTMEAHELDPSISKACLALMDRLGLVFGCLDFIVTPKGEHAFLEVNQMGQFLFVETYAGLPLLDAFSEMLLQGCADFEWDPARAEISYDEEIRSQVRARVEEVKTRHAAAPGRQWKE